MSSFGGIDPDADSQLASVAAVVVTYRRPRLATDVVRGLLQQEGLAPHQVFVVVNGDGGLDHPDLAAAVQTINLSENLGPAAGFREGMRAAVALGGCEWFYLCEDDIGLFDLPMPRLRTLLDDVAEGSFPGPVGAIVAYGRDLHDRTGHTTMHEVSEAKGFVSVDAACWGATLVHRRVLEAGILPCDDYFFGYEDFDFFYRLRQAGFLVLLDRRAAFRVAPQMSLHGRDAAFRGKRPLDVDEPWRAFYVARNYFLLARRHGSAGWVLAHLLYSVRRLQLAGSQDERGAILRGLLAGLLGRRGKDPRFVRDSGEMPAGSPEHPEGQPDPAATQGRFVLHVLPCDIARGGQVIARDLRDLLNQRCDRHEILTIFDSEPVVLFAEHRLTTKMGWRRSMGFDPLAYLRLRAALSRLRPDVIVAHGGEPLKYLAFMRKRRAPLVYFAFGIVTKETHSGLRRSFYRRMMRRAEMVAGISKETRDEARDLFGVPLARLALLPNSRDPDVYQPADDDKESGLEVKLIFVGHLTTTKRPELFVALVGELRRKGRLVVGEIIGDGPLEAEVRRLAADAGVSVLGRRTDVDRMLQGADVFIFTSVPESEGMPGVLIEAGLAGLPVVATACPGVSTVLATGETGFIVDVDDFDQLVATVERLVIDLELRRRMGRAARQRCLKEFSLEASGSRWQEVLDRLAPRRGASAVNIGDGVPHF